MRIAIMSSFICPILYIFAHMHNKLLTKARRSEKEGIAADKEGALGEFVNS